MSFDQIWYHNYEANKHLVPKTSQNSECLGIEIWYWMFGAILPHYINLLVTFYSMIWNTMDVSLSSKFSFVFGKWLFIWLKLINSHFCLNIGLKKGPIGPIGRFHLALAEGPLGPLVKIGTISKKRDAGWTGY